MDSWERFNETSFADKEAFYSKLNEEGISNIDYSHGQKIWKIFEIKNLGEYHDLYVQSDILVLDDVFENLRDTFIEIYKLNPAHFLSAPGLSWLAWLKKTGVELELFTDYNMLLMAEKGIKGGKCDVIHRYAKANNKYMRNYNNNTESSYLMYLDAKNLYGWAMSQKLPINSFKWVGYLSQFDESFIKSYDENSDKGYILEVDLEYAKKLFNHHKDYSVLPERKEL